MTARDLAARFPEIPEDIRDEEVLARFACRFGPWLESARKPSACAGQHSAENRCYLKLVGPMDIYRYGLATRERVLGQLEAMLRDHAEDPAAFEASLTGEDA